MPDILQVCFYQSQYKNMILLSGFADTLNVKGIFAMLDTYCHRLQVLIPLKCRILP